MVASLKNKFIKAFFHKAVPVPLILFIKQKHLSFLSFVFVDRYTLIQIAARSILKIEEERFSFDHARLRVVDAYYIEQMAPPQAATL